ncbi:hypothetical protein [Sulfuritalea sp.]|uniref:hypothetical protein n=1 Tax=Sulfuritalea sp. TaxID=2480090 RepID=UPI0025EB793E|nr:hypothetical protein [Sulfuritalea sp.]
MNTRFPTPFFSGHHRRFPILAVLATAALIAGCAHPLAIGPDLAKIERKIDDRQIELNVGYYMSATDKDRMVITPGGGGDTVTYAPYKDMEAAFYKMLGNAFKSVTLLKSPTDAEAIQKNSISYVISPEISTDSSSPSPFTWPPTLFVVNLTCNIADPSGKIVVKPSVTGAGRAEFDEFKSDFSLSGKRAVIDAMMKMQGTLVGLPEFRKP